MSKKIKQAAGHTAQFLSRDAILAVQDTAEREIVNVSEWGGQVLVRGLTAKERDQFEASIVDGKGNADLSNMRAKLVAYGTIDADGKRLFTLADVEKLGDKSGRPIIRIAAAVQRLSGMNDRDLEELSAAASVTTPAADKTGDSRSPSDAPAENSTQA